jgi:lipopolysaccharide transport system ATP-binding protein
VGSLLEVGTGFHPELTGRENIYLNGAILGMRQAEIGARFDEIVAFAEIDKFLDTPVKRYSSGMYVRLAFAVAAYLEPEILLVDEVLAVGDAEFQKKCLGKMSNVAQGGRTVLFVSHNMGAIKNLCSKVILIDKGRLIEIGNASTIVDKYLTSGEIRGGEIIYYETNQMHRDNKVRLLRVSVKNQYGAVSDSFPIDIPFYIEIEYELQKRLDNLRIGFRLINSDGTIVLTSNDTDPEGNGTSRDPGIYTSKCTIPGNLLNCNQYYISVAGDMPMKEIIFFEDHVVSFTIVQTGGIGGTVPDGRLGVIRLGLGWEILPSVKCADH